jgi:hypothetical protein
MGELESDARHAGKLRISMLEILKDIGRNLEGALSMLNKRKMAQFLLIAGLVFLLCGMKPSAHHDLAFKSAKDAHFSDAAAEIIAIGAVAPDQYDWETAAAHGQTPNDKNGYPKMSKGEAVAAFYRYIQEKSAQVDAALSTGNSAEALYRIGYIMHAFQDLSVHMGMTNYAHSKLAAEGMNPDVNTDRIARASEWSKEFLERSSNRWNSQWKNLQQYNGPKPNEFDKIATAISTGDADRTWTSLVSYWWSRFSPVAPPSGLWGDINEIERIRSIAINRVSATGAFSGSQSGRAAADTTHCFPEKQSCIGNCPLGTTSSLCPDQCELSYILCQGQTPDAKLVRSIARTKALDTCTKNSNDCHKNCSMDNLQAWNQCLDRCNNASDACRAAAPAP